MVSEQLWELNKLMLSNHRRWFNSSRVKCSFVKMSASWFLDSASWFLDSTYLIWIMGSKFILSNNQSRATLWVLETCLKLGLLPLMIILITASLSSKMYNIARLWEEFTFEEPKSTFDNSIWFWEFCVWHCEFILFSDALLKDRLPRTYLNFCSRFDFECQISMTKSQRSNAGIPSIRKPASREMISDSVELCDTHVCFLHIQHIGTNVWPPNMHNILTWSWFRIFIDLLQNQNLETVPIDIVAQYFPHDNIVCIHLCNECDEIKRAKRLSHALVHLVIARASLLTDHRISGLPMRAKYIHFRTICELTSDKSPTDFNSSSVNWWLSMHGVDTL